jgi:23S rRNA pseudouridine1911/1915/1917 synthase
MRYAGHPVIGDPLYGRGNDRTNLGLKRQFLHSWHIAFDHPVTGEAIVEADPLPVDLIDILKKLGARSMGRTAAGDVICPHVLGV